MTPTEKLAIIEGKINEGKTIYINTYTSSTVISPKTYAKWVKSGHPLFKATEKSLYVARGKSFDCIDYCSIQAH